LSNEVNIPGAGKVDPTVLLANIVESADDAIISKDLTGTITSWNKAAEKIFGYAAREVIGGPISVIIPPERGDEEIEILRRISRGERIEHFETVRVRKDGSRVQVSVTISPLVQNGRIIGASKIARDISEQHEAVQQIQQERARLEVTLASIGDAVIVTDVQGAVTFMNPVAEALTGWSRQQAEGQQLETVFHIISEATRRRGNNPVIRALQEGQIVGLANHTLLIAKDGTEHAIDDSAAPIRDLAGNVTGVVLVFRDVTGQRALEHHRARLAAIIESSEDAILAKDMQGRITSWNEAAARLFGYTAEEAIGRPVSIILPTDRLGEEAMILEKVRNGERLEHLETVRLNRDRRKIQVALTISPIRNAEGEVVGVSKIARDITARKAMEENLAKARAELESYAEQLEEAVRQRTAELELANSELEAFSYTVAHDLRSPLRHLRGGLGILQDEAASVLKPEQRDLIARLSSTAEALSRLIDALLTLSKAGKDPVVAQPTPLDQLVQHAIAELNHELDDRRVEWKVLPLPIVRCDAALMQQAITNLLSNALKYTRTRPQALIEVGQVETPKGRAVFVRDNGVGFSPEQAGQIFAPFHRLHPERQFEGHGIGLATVERIIRRHGGSIWAEAAPEKGATFYFVLPDGGAKPPT
jgi:PAS domain S-box-containing protein